MYPSRQRKHVVVPGLLIMTCVFCLLIVLTMEPLKDDGTGRVSWRHTVWEGIDSTSRSLDKPTNFVEVIGRLEDAGPLASTPANIHQTNIEVRGTVAPVVEKKTAIAASPSDDDSTDSLAVPLLRPVLEWQTYQQEHSDEVLEYELLHDRLAIRNRRFAVVPYTCPHRVGNFWHNAVHTITWAIVHNRTILLQPYKLQDQDTNCQGRVLIPSWIPLYEKWRFKLALPNPEPWPMLTNSVRESGSSALEPAHRDHNSIMVARFPQIPDIDSKETNITRCQWVEDLSRPKFRDYLNHHVAQNKLNPRLTSFLPSRMVELYQEGADFLDGMLFHTVFPLSPSATAADRVNDGSTFSVALHSRHISPGDDGSFLPSEIACLQHLLLNQTTATSCRVVLLSDRDLSIEIMQKWIHTHTNCTVVTASDHRGKADPNVTTFLYKTPAEHGPHAGLGFLDEISMATKSVLDAVVGDPHRSSFEILHKLAIYHRATVDVSGGATNVDAASTPLHFCELPLKKVKGYNYGPNTPMFRHPRNVEPLPAKEILDVYIARHGHDVMQREWEDHGELCATRQFLVVPFDCNSSSTDWTGTNQSSSSMDDWLNGMVWAVITNRTALWTCRTWSSKWRKFVPRKKNEGRPQSFRNTVVENADQHDKKHPYRTLWRPQPWMTKWETWANQVNVKEESLETFSTLRTSRLARVLRFSSDFPPLPLSTTNPRKTPTGHTSPATEQNTALSLWQFRWDTLFDQGTDYLYGMLHKHTLEWRTTQRPTIHTSDSLSTEEAAGFTVGLILNQPPRLMSTFTGRQRINRELTDCLDRLLPVTTQASTTNLTRAIALSSSFCTILLVGYPLDTVMEEWLRSFRSNCRLRTSHNKENRMQSSSFSSSGLSRSDADFISQARDGLVVFAEGNSLTATVIRQRITYERTEETWQLGRVPMQLSPLRSCLLSVG